MLVTILIAVTEIGLAIRAQLLAQEAVAAGAHYAIKGFNATTIAAAVQSSSSVYTIQASPAPTEFYACPATTGLTRVTVGSTCSDTKTARHFVDVYASVTRPTVFGSSFGLPSTLTAHAEARAP